MSMFVGNVEAKENSQMEAPWKIRMRSRHWHLKRLVMVDGKTR